MADTAAQVIEIPAERQGEAAGLLARAFAHDPLMLHLFDGGSGYRARLTGFLRYTCEVQIAMGWPLLGLVPRTRLAAVAAVTPPEPASWPEALTERYTALATRLSPRQRERLKRYAALPGVRMPDTPLFYCVRFQSVELSPSIRVLRGSFPDSVPLRFLVLGSFSYPSPQPRSCGADQRR